MRAAHVRAQRVRLERSGQRPILRLAQHRRQRDPIDSLAVGAADNVRTRVRSPHPNAKSRKRRRAISIKGGKDRTGSRTPVGFTVLNATPVFPPTNDYTNDHTNHNGQLDDAACFASTRG